MWFLLATACISALAAPPPLVPTSEGRVHIDGPADWKVLVKDRPQMHNITMSGGLSTTVTLYWYDLQPGVTHEILLDVLRDTVNETLPVGEMKELSRRAVPDMDDEVSAMQMPGEVTVGMGPLKYTMTVAAVTLIDKPAQRVIAAFLVAQPEVYADMEGMETLTDIVRSLRLDDDPLRPIPAWWWDASPPELLARPAEPL